MLAAAEPTTPTAEFAELICSEPDWLEAEFAALLARSGLRPRVRTAAAGPPPVHRATGRWPERPRLRGRTRAIRLRAVARCPPAAQPTPWTSAHSAATRTPR